MNKSAFKKNGAINSAVLWRGQSEIDQKPIVLIAIVKSGNRKTGAMVQTYIIRDDIDPVTANRTGADYSICGDCPLKGIPAPDKETGTAKDRPCYVVLGQGPTVVYKTFNRGGYPVLALDYNLPDQFAELGYYGLLQEYGRDQLIRAGTYGDPGAVPVFVWEALYSKARGGTGYTHQIERPELSAPALASFCMVSAESEKQAREQWKAGRRTFRIIASTSELIPDKEVICPATPEGGKRTTCEHCKLCGGSNVSAKSVAVVVHGSGAKHASQLIGAVNL